MDGTRVVGELENESKADSLGMAISVVCLADRADKASSSKSLFALPWVMVRLYSHAGEIPRAVHFLPIALHYAYCHLIIDMEFFRRNMQTHARIFQALFRRLTRNQVLTAPLPAISLYPMFSVTKF